MMKLLIDAGNTRIKWQLRDRGSVLASGAGNLGDGELFGDIARPQWKALSAVAASTVRSEAARLDLESAIAGYTDVPVRFYWTQKSFGSLVCAYDDPSSMGADRWHAMVAAWSQVAGSCVVVDAGSAITIDWIDGQGLHTGGYILPDRAMMTGSLRQTTARVLFEDSPGMLSTSPGRSTAECVFHGVNWLMQVLASGSVRDSSVPVLVTGGDGSYIKKALDTMEGCSRVESRLCPGLVLDGLALVEAE